MTNQCFTSLPHFIVSGLLQSVRTCQLQCCLLSVLLLAGLGSMTVQANEEEASAETLPAHEQVSINRADAGTIAVMLDGIGQTKAKAIIRYRDEHGDFNSLEDLTLVSGIGDRTVENNRERINLD